MHALDEWPTTCARSMPTSRMSAWQYAACRVKLTGPSTRPLAP